MTDDKITDLIAKARRYGPESMSSQLIHNLADALEAEHQRAEALVSDIQALGRENSKLEYKDDALRAVIQRALVELEPQLGSPASRARRILSRAIDTKEETK